MTDFYQLSAVSNRGNEVRFQDFVGKPVLIVNTASQCGFTPQYRGLEALYRKYHERGLEILGFPCDQFGHQEPGSDQEIATFCSTQYDVTFPIMKKTDVNGDGAHPVYKYLKAQAGGVIVDAIKWNFTKFLVSPDGKKVERYAPTTTPESLEKDIESLL